MITLSSRNFIGILTLVVAVWIIIARPYGLSDNQAYSGALIIITLALWATAILPEIITCLMFFLAAILLSVAPADIIFSGFHSTANWTVFGGLIIGLAVQETKLGARISNVFARHFRSGYPGIIAGVVTAGVVLSFLMPSSMGRIVLMAPIAISIAQRFKFKPGTNGYLGIILAMGFGTSAPASGILPANVPNLVLMGGAESLYDVVLTYGPYLLLHFPTLGLLKALLIIVVILVMFPARLEISDAMEEEDPPSSSEKRLGLFLCVALAAWITDFLHEISPAWIALAVALACMLPKVGVLPKDIFAGKINFVPIFLTAAILGVGAVVDDVGLGEIIGRELHRVIQFKPDQDHITFFSVILIDTLVQFLITSPGIAAVMVPLSGSIAEASAIPVETIVNMHAVGYSNYMLPYQMGPLLILSALCNVSNSDLTRLCFFVGFLGLVILTPITYLWWVALGYLN